MATINNGVSEGTQYIFSEADNQQTRNLFFDKDPFVTAHVSYVLCVFALLLDAVVCITVMTSGLVFFNLWIKYGLMVYLHLKTPCNDITNEWWDEMLERFS